MEDKTPLSQDVVRFQMLDFETLKSKFNSEVSKSNSWKIDSRKLYYTSEWAVSHNVL